MALWHNFLHCNADRFQFHEIISECPTTLLHVSCKYCVAGFTRAQFLDWVVYAWMLQSHSCCTIASWKCSTKYGLEGNHSISACCHAVVHWVLDMCLCTTVVGFTTMQHNMMHWNWKKRWSLGIVLNVSYYNSDTTFSHWEYTCHSLNHN